MPRDARIDFPGLLQHVIVRGIERRDIFLEDQDRENFTLRLKTLLDETGTTCFAWCLMDNHFHLLVRPADTPLAVFMRRLLTGYVVSFNLRHNRAGHLFQNRYKSIVCDEDGYLLELIRYIHLNPIRAGIMTDLDQLSRHPWCGHHQLMERSDQNLINTKEVLSRFSQKAATARNIYLEFLADGLRQEKPLNLSRGGRNISRGLDSSLSDEDIFDERILGGGDFAQDILNRQKEPPPAPKLDQLITKVAEFYGMNAESIVTPTKERGVVQAKSVICYLAIRRFSYSGVEVAHRIGYSTSAASHATSRGKKLFENNQEIQTLFLKCGNNNNVLL